MPIYQPALTPLAHPVYRPTLGGVVEPATIHASVPGFITRASPARPRSRTDHRSRANMPTDVSIPASSPPASSIVCPVPHPGRSHSHVVFYRSPGRVYIWSYSSATAAIHF